MAKQTDFRRQQYVEACITRERIESEDAYDARNRTNSVAAEQTPQTAGNYLSRKETAKKLHVSPATVDRLRKKGVLKEVSELLPLVRFRESDVDTFRRLRKK